MNRPSQILSSASDAIGNTCLVDLQRITKDLDGQILAKLEMLNPGFSKKDRAALRIILDAEEQGELTSGQPVVELTSGNMGTGLAIVCATRGYPFTAVMSRGNSEERTRMMAALGTRVVLVDQQPGSKPGQVSGADLALVEEETARIVAETGAFRADQFRHQGNLRSHYLGTGPELWRQSAGSITGFCDFVGSGGTYAGVAKYLKGVWLTNNVIIVYTPHCHQPLTGVVTHENHRRQPSKRNRPPPDRHRHERFYAGRGRTHPGRGE